MSVYRYDRAPIKARFTEDGYLEDSPVLTRTGVFTYRDGKGGIRRELRRPEDVFSQDSLATYRNKPITKGHHGKVAASTVKKYQIGTVTSEGRQDGNDVTGDIVIHDPRVVKQDGWKELSVGYLVDTIEEPGEYNGERYDAIQTNIRVNHLAVVPEGRAGNARLNLDSADAEQMSDAADAATPTDDDKGDPIMDKVRLDNGIEYDAAPEVGQAYKQARSDLDDAKTKLEQEKARADAAEQAKEEAENQAEQIKQDAVKQARARLELEAKAKEHKVEVKEDAADRDLKVSVIKAIRGDSVDLTDKEDAYIDAAYDYAVADADKRRDDAANQRKVSTGINQDGVPAKGGSAAEAREKMAARMRGEKVEDDQ
ncbi:DUF2213 domain-containing protein [Halomonas elongata]|uniref:DUF2213 domain-containing protein n=1 Tax=Halomonas elongata TaxID=2746 RepID=UPI002E28FCA6|nr:DUF2213 domain-containing protein [Halomonas elongata]WVI72707.1 DUF2213 domain-containing protein [Halomonas elongata]